MSEIIFALHTNLLTRLNNFDPYKFIIQKDLFVKFVFLHIMWWIICGLACMVPLELKTKRLTYDFKTRIVSIIHATTIFLMSLYDVIYYQSNKCGETNSDFENLMFLISASYFIYDIFACLILECTDIEMVLHHTFVTVAYWSSLAYNSTSKEIVLCLIVTEITCPVMHIRAMIKNVGLKHTKIYELLDICFMVTYLFARMGFGSYVTWFTLACPDNLLLVKLGGAFVWVQSLLFSKRMIKILLHKIKEFKERKKNKVKLFWFEMNKKVEELEYFKRKEKYVP